MNEDSPKIEESNLPTPIRERVSAPLLVAIIIGAWMIGVSILGAGWLISREIARQGIDQSQYGNQTGSIEITIPDNKPFLGNPEAKVIVVEFADYQCPYCGEWQKTIFQNLKSEYIETGKIKFVFWDFAFLGPESTRAAEATLCAKDQDRYWDYHDKLFANQDGENLGAFSDGKLTKFAQELNLDTEKFSNCLAINNYNQEVTESLQLGTSYGVTATPSVFINGTKVEGIMPWATYKAMIDSELNQN